MINHNDPAFPNSSVAGDYEEGITVRQYFAAMALQGLLSSVNLEKVGDMLGQDFVAERAVIYADALIAALNDSDASK